MTHTETHDTAARVAAPGAPVAPPPAPAKTEPAKRRERHGARKRLRAAKPRPRRKRSQRQRRRRPAAKQVSAPRAESKGAQILALIRRSKGATLAEMQKTTGWQAHSVRGYLSSAAKKHNLRIESTKNEEGDRVYHIQS